MLVFYIPAGYYIDTMMWRKRERARIRAATGRAADERSTSRCSPSARSPRTASCCAARAPTAVLIVDPGEEAERILAAVEAMGGDGRGDPRHPLPLRPHRRRRAGRRGDRRPGLLPRARDAGPRRHHGLSSPGRDSARIESYEADETVERRRDARAGRARDRRRSSPPATAPATSPTRSATRTRSSPATSSSRARSGASTCPAATGRR